MITIRKIAAKAGLSKSAVSLALRNHPRIPTKTREHVLAVAHELGYRANPVFAQMMRAVRATGPLQTQAIIGILHGFAEPQPGRSVPYHAEWVGGARTRAEGLGYVVDELWMKEPGMSARRLSQIIHARGISALMIAPLPEKRGIQLDWEHFSAVTAGFSLTEPRLSRVVPNHQQTMLVCLRQMAARGYRRVGLVLDVNLDPLARFNLSAPFLWYQDGLSASWRVPALNLKPGDRAAFLRWLKRSRPEAIITVTGACLAWLKAEKISIPNDIGLVFTSRTLSPPGFCCVDQQPRKLGAAAVDLLVAQLNRAEFGVPSNPKTVFTDVAWSEGTSLRQIRPALDCPGLNVF